jgi:cobalt-precorrin-5B (C1)-methyltransferase
LAAAAASKAAALSLRGETVSSVVVPTPIGLRIEVQVERVWREGDYSCASVKKFSGDNPDVLDGAEIASCVKPSSETKIIGGKGVGKVEGEWLRGTEGYAISEGARKLILNALAEVGGNYEVVISVPRGEELAKLTMNESIGIKGGISILGTTGIEWPMSDEDFEAHVRATVCEDINSHNGELVLVPGNTAYEFAVRKFGHAVKVGDWVGAALDEAKRRGVKKVVLVSLPGKLVKLSSGMLNTHSKYGDCRVESLVYSAILAGVQFEKVREIVNAKSVSEALYKLGEEEAPKVMKVVAERALKVIKRVVDVPVTVIALDEKGRKVLGVAEG